MKLPEISVALGFSVLFVAPFFLGCARSRGNAPTGARCSTTNDCSSGLVCVSASCTQPGTTLPGGFSVVGATKVFVGGTLKFLTNPVQEAVVWSVPDGVASGTISAKGDYVAPLVPGSYRVQANVPGAAPVVVSVQVVDALVLLGAPTKGKLGVQILFSTNLPKNLQSSLSWSIAEGAVAGTIDATGLFTPASIGTFHVSATSTIVPAPQVTTTVAIAANLLGYTPVEALPGATVTLAGRGFGATQGSSSLAFAEKSVAATTWSDTAITFVLPKADQLGSALGASVVTVGGVPSDPLVLPLLFPPGPGSVASTPLFPGIFFKNALLTANPQVGATLVLTTFSSVINYNTTLTTVDRIGRAPNSPVTLNSTVQETATGSASNGAAYVRYYDPQNGDVFTQYGGNAPAAPWSNKVGLFDPSGAARAMLSADDAGLTLVAAPLGSDGKFLTQQLSASSGSQRWAGNPSSDPNFSLEMNVSESILAQVSTGGGRTFVLLRSVDVGGNLSLRVVMLQPDATSTPKVGPVTLLDALKKPQTGSAGDFAAKLAADGSGGIYVVWQALPSIGDPSECKAQHFGKDGTALWATAGVSVKIPPAAFLQTLLASAQTAPILAWSIKPNASVATLNLSVTRLSTADGASSWTTALGDQKGSGEAALVEDGKGGALVAWVGASTAMVSQRVNTDGTLAWPAAVTLSVATGTGCSGGVCKGFVAGVPDGSGGALFGWLDGSSPPKAGYFVQGVSALGTL